MEIAYLVGNLVTSDELIIAHGCNAQGKMNSGVAKVIRERWPEVYKEYFEAWQRGEIVVGVNQNVFTKSGGTSIVVNCITQEFYGYDGAQYVSYWGIRECMKKLNELAQEVNSEPHLLPEGQRFVRIGLPMIGSDRGGGDWATIVKIIEEESTDFQPIVYVLDESRIPKKETV